MSETIEPATTLEPTPNDPPLDTPAPNPPLLQQQMGLEELLGNAAPYTETHPDDAPKTIDLVEAHGPAIIPPPPADGIGTDGYAREVAWYEHIKAWMRREIGMHEAGVSVADRVVHNP